MLSWLPSLQTPFDSTATAYRTVHWYHDTKDRPDGRVLANHASSALSSLPPAATPSIAAKCSRRVIWNN